MHSVKSIPPTLFGLLIQKTGYVYAVWFFIVLFVTEVCFYFIAKHIKNTRGLVALLFFLIAVDVVYFKMIAAALPFQLQICFTALPFFMIGYLLKKSNIIEFLNRHIYIYILLALAISAIFFFIKCRYMTAYTSLTSNQYGNFFIFYCLAIATIMFVLLLSCRIKKVKPINYLGKNTVVLFALQQPLVSLPLNLLIIKL